MIPGTAILPADRYLAIYPAFINYCTIELVVK